MILFLLVIFGAALRLFRFPEVPISMFADEVDIGYQVFSFRQTGADYFGNFLPLQFHSFSDVRTSLPIYATILVSYLPGVSLELAIRLTPLLFSLGSLVLIYFFTNALWEHFRLDRPKGFLLPGHFAVLLLALAPWHFTYSRTAFELSQLFFTTTLGFYLFLRYLKSNQSKTLIASLLVLGATPLVYSTAKLAILGYPLILWLLADEKQRHRLLSRWYLCAVIFLPLVILLLSGGAGQRFKEIAIFTDPTISSEINYRRQLDLGPNLVVGSSPSFTTKLVHNKATLILGRFFKNSLTSISGAFLFIAGDPNLRHAVGGWGMLTKTYLIFLVFGFFILFRNHSKNISLTLLALAVISIAPSALTRDGADHSSRLFMLLLPLIILTTLGAVYLSRFRFMSFVIFALLLVESFFYFHDYFTHYPYDSEKQFHTGVKELVQKAAAEKTFVVVSPKYEPPLIFYLFYNRFNPKEFQKLLKEKKLYHEIGPDLNLEGYQLGDDEIYFASIRNLNAAPLFPVKGVYYITPLEAAAIYGSKLEQMKPEIKSPSGLPLFYRIEAN